MSQPSGIPDYSEYHESGRFHGIYGRSINPDAAGRIVASVRELLQTQDRTTCSFRDFGSAHGRYLAVAETIALKCPNIQFSYQGYDPYEEGLEKFRERLEEDGYALENLQYPVYKNSIRTLSHYRKGNMTVELVTSRVDVTPEQLGDSFDPVDFTLSMLGSVAHINTREKRVNTLKMLGETTVGEIIFEVPSRETSFQDELTFWDKQRVKGQDLGQATGEGDIYYVRDSRDGHPLMIYYHLYKEDELTEDTQAAGLDLPTGLLRTVARTQDNIANIDEDSPPKNRWKHRINGTDYEDYLVIARGPHTVMKSKSAAIERTC